MCSALQWCAQSSLSLDEYLDERKNDCYYQHTLHKHCHIGIDQVAGSPVAPHAEVHIHIVSYAQTICQSISMVKTNPSLRLS